VASPRRALTSIPIGPWPHSMFEIRGSLSVSFNLIKSRPSRWPKVGTGAVE
jgi:hypothetical protein